MTHEYSRNMHKIIRILLADIAAKCMQHYGFWKVYKLTIKIANILMCLAMQQVFIY